MITLLVVFPISEPYIGEGIHQLKTPLPSLSYIQGRPMTRNWSQWVRLQIAFKEGWHSREAFPLSLSHLFSYFLNYGWMDTAAAVTLQLWGKLEDGHDVLGMMEQIKRRNLSSWQCCSAAYHGLPTSDFFCIRKGTLLSCESTDLGDCLFNVAEPNLIWDSSHF